jgi:acetyl-CoA synthetase
MPEPAHRQFRAARDLLLDCAGDIAAARAKFRWPELSHFNWALDWFDEVAAGNHSVALRVLSPDRADAVTFAELSARSSAVASWLRGVGVERGEGVFIVLDNCVETWEILLALMKLRAVAIPVFTSLSTDELSRRLHRSRARHLVASEEAAGRLADSTPDGVSIVIGQRPGWLSYHESESQPAEFTPAGPTAASELMSCFFTSGSTAPPKLVAHTHVSYPVGHLSGMYWAGLRPGDIHLNVSSPGWAKHPWSSMFAPWNAEATVVSVDTRHASPAFVRSALDETGATTFCAPPGLWRSLAQHGLGQRPAALREAMSVGEPLARHVAATVGDAWRLPLRNGYGQSEVTALAGVLPGDGGDPTALGAELPGYRIVLLAPGSITPADEGEVCLDLGAGALGLMHGYLDDDGRRIGPPPASLAYYRTGDLARRNAEGGLVFIGRIKDLFRAPGGGLVAPAAVEAALTSHPAVHEGAVVGVSRIPDGSGPVVAKAHVVLADGWNAGPVTAEALFSHVNESFGAAQGMVLLEFVDALPRTESGKIFRDALRGWPRSVLAEYTSSPPGAREERTGG